MEQNNNGQQQNTQRHQIANRESDQNGMSFLLKKGEKLTTALYMVTDIMGEREPMKWKIRENGVELLSDIAVSYGSSASERMSVMSNAMKKIEKIISFLEITERAHMISEMNASVLKKEYLALKDAVEKEWNNIYDKSRSIFPESFFEVPRESIKELKEAPKEFSKETLKETLRETSSETLRETLREIKDTSHTQTLPPDRSERRDHQVQYQGQKDIPRIERKIEPKEIKPPQILPPYQPRVVEQEQQIERQPTTHTDQVARPVQSVMSTRVPQGEVARPQIFHPKHTVSRDLSITRPHGDVRANDRRSIILAKIKEKPSLNVKDISANIPYVSEKTIQRELLAMVAEGILVKRGERRWSTYSLRQG